LGREFGMGRELGLSHLLSQRNHFRHFLEESNSSRDGVLVSWLFHTFSTALRKTPQLQPCRAAHFGREQGIPSPSTQRHEPYWLRGREQRISLVKIDIAAGG
jgi:hypothetical protein